MVSEKPENTGWRILSETDGHRVRLKRSDRQIPCRAGCVWQSRGESEHIRSRREYSGGHGNTRFCEVAAGVLEARAGDARAFQGAHAADYVYSDGQAACPAQ